MISQPWIPSVGQALDLLSEFRSRLDGMGDRGVPQELLRGVFELQALMRKLQLRYGLLHQILDLTNDLVAAKDRDGRYAMVNPSGSELFGRSVEEILGNDDRALLGCEDAARIMAIDREVMADGMPRTREEALVIGGEARKWLVTTTAWQDVAHTVRGVIAIAQDVTDRERRERAALLHAGRLSAMATEIVVAEERLRRALAADLHNGLGQDIALAKLKLSSLRNAIHEELRPPLTGIELLVDQADRALRSITYRISPPSLHDLGLFAALQWLAEDLGARFGVEISITDEGSPPVEDEVARVLLFRAVRELLINAVTHADVRTMTVRLGRVAERVTVMVEDNGRGFDAGDSEAHGYGLFGIREQLRSIDGTMQLVSKPGRGTSVTLSAPVGENPRVLVTDLSVH
ncbi:MAG TPA: PAS domain-containing protein [Planctomycetota bacterium]|nr:PAS domain-containing protein [Planctomycetota bacterium]